MYDNLLEQCFSGLPSFASCFLCRSENQLYRDSLPMFLQIPCISGSWHMSEVPCKTHVILIVNIYPNNWWSTKTFENHRFILASYCHLTDYWNMYIDMKTVHKTMSSTWPCLRTRRVWIWRSSFIHVNGTRSVTKISLVLVQILKVHVC